MHVDATTGLRFAGFEFDARRDELRKDGVAIPIRPKPRALLRHFLDHPGRLLGKDELIGALWGTVVVSDDSLVQCVGELRAALGDRGELIKTLPRRGYLFDAAVEKLSVRPLEATPSAAPTLPDAASRPKSRLRHWLAPCVCASLLGCGIAVWKLQQPAPMHVDDEIVARHSVAVLPLADADDPERAAALGAALADRISLQVSMRQGARVIGPAAVTGHDAAMPNIARIGHEQGVHYVIGGHVLQQDGAVVVDATLTSVETGELVLLNRSTFASAADALHSNLDQRVASAFRMQYYESDAARATQPGHAMDAADLTLMGWRDLNRFASRDDVLRARGRFEAALRVDPASVMALQGLGSTYQIEIVNGFSREPQKLLEPGKRALGRAIELSPDRPENLLPWGSLLELDGRPAEAMAVYAKALAVNPDYAFGHLFVAHLLIRQGRYDEARREIDRARGLSPADTRLIYAIYALSAITDFAQDRDDDAYGWSMRWAAEYPRSGQPHAMLAAIDALHGRAADAAAHMARHRELMPNDTIACVTFIDPSTDPGYLKQRARLVEGLRKAGLPER
jgi:DNA-binding winged helix-turn-helix (wHTH) protein/tetratricopeptide (TPR) repeat protein